MLRRKAYNSEKQSNNTERKVVDRNREETDNQYLVDYYKYSNKTTFVESME